MLRHHIHNVYALLNLFNRVRVKTRNVHKEGLGSRGWGLGARK
jgi:hypothetical protein